MKFIVDAQPPQWLAAFLNQKGFDAIHTFDLPTKNKTSDFQIAQLAIAENRIVVTKDVDFLDSFLIKGEPTKPIMVKTANLYRYGICISPIPK